MMYVLKYAQPVECEITMLPNGYETLTITDVLIWDSKDSFNVHQISNIDEMFEKICEEGKTYSCYTQEQYEKAVKTNIEDIFRNNALLQISSLKRVFSSVYGTITSVNQDFIKLIKESKKMPRIHPCYSGSAYLITHTAEFERLVCWLAEFDKPQYDLKFVEKENKTMSEQHKEAKWFEELLHSINLGLDEFCDKACGKLQGEWTKSGTIRTIQFTEREHFSVICYTPENTYVHSIMMGVDNTPAIRIEVEEFKDHVMFNVTRGVQPPSYLFTEEEWLLMFDIMDKKMTELSKKYAHQETDTNIPKEETLSSDADNGKATLWETMRDGINTTLNSFCDKIISDSIVGGSYKKSGSLRRITLGEKTIDIILEFDTDLDSWAIFVGDATKPRILINDNGDITVDISAFIPDPLCFKDIQTLCDMLTACKNKNWQVKEDTHEEHIEKNSEKEFEAFSQSLIKDGKRPTKEEYYLAMAEVASTSGTCLRRRFGAIIVKNNRIVSTGYVGAPSGREHCSDIGYCFREHHKIPSGTMYEKCRSTHAEMNAIIQASKEEMEGATLYLVGVEPDGSYTNADCCAMCKRVIINSGIEKVVAKQKNGMYNIIPVKEWIEHDDSLDINHKGY